MILNIYYDILKSLVLIKFNVDYKEICYERF